MDRYPLVGIRIPANLAAILPVFTNYQVFLYYTVNPVGLNATMPWMRVLHPGNMAEVHCR
jgi:hypothetical protein